MIYGLIEEKLENKLKEIKEAGLYKTERIITSALVIIRSVL